MLLQATDLIRRYSTVSLLHRLRAGGLREKEYPYYGYENKTDRQPEQDFLLRDIHRLCMPLFDEDVLKCA